VGQRRSGSHPRIAPGRPAIADKVRSYGRGIPCLPATCRSGPCPRFARRAHSYRGMLWVGQRRSGFHPRFAPEVPAIADKVRSYGGGIPCLPVTCRSRPCLRFARRARSYRGMLWVGQRRSGSHPRIAPEVPAIADKVRSYGRGIPCPRQPVGAGPARDSRAGRAPTMGMLWVGQRRSGSHPRIAPTRPAIADKVRSYGRGIPCLPVTCRSRPCLRFARRARSYRGMLWVGQRRSGSHPRIAPEVPAIADKVRSYGGGIPCLPATCRSRPCLRFARRARSYEKRCSLRSTSLNGTDRCSSARTPCAAGSCASPPVRGRVRCTPRPGRRSRRAGWRGIARRRGR